MAFALRRAQGPLELLPGTPIVSGDVQFSYDTMLLWSDAERAAHGVFPIVEPDAVPVGKVANGSTLADDGTAVRRVLTLVDAPPPAVPDIISDRQCFQQLAILGKITQDEALAAVTVGALPKVITDGIASLPDEQQFPARMMLCGATQFQRSNPMTPVLGAFLGLDGPGLDALWQAAALL